MNPYISELLFFIVILATAGYHAYRFNNHIKTGSAFHLLWATITGAIIVLVCWLAGWNYLLAGALAIERFILFNPLLNLMRKPRKPFFYISSGKNGSWMDRVLTKVYEPACAIAVTGFIILQFFL
jgi:hypothetical protein